MQRSTLIFTVLIAGAVHIHAQGLLEAITAPEKAIPVVNQTLEGTWLLELRRPGTPAAQAPISKLIIFHRDGTDAVQFQFKLLCFPGREVDQQ